MYTGHIILPSLAHKVLKLKETEGNKGIIKGLICPPREKTLRKIFIAVSFLPIFTNNETTI